MSNSDDILTEILDISKKIFDINDKYNSSVIFGDKTFIVNGDNISVEQNDCEERCYYFEHYKISGAIFKNVNDEEYCVKASVKYINTNGKEWNFAKIRIYNNNGNISIKGRRTGNWVLHDFEDEDFIKEPDYELPLVLDSMKNSLLEMHTELCNNLDTNIDMYNPSWVKELKMYNK